MDFNIASHITRLVPQLARLSTHHDNLAIQIDNFLDNFGVFRKHCDGLTYEPIVNDIDGVIYPGICAEVPGVVRAEILSKMQDATGKKLYNPIIFLRLSLQGDEVPHEAHTDATMGDIGAIIYMTRKGYCRGGTSFIQHKSGMRFNPDTQSEVALWEKDHNKYGQWDILQKIWMKQNRGFIFDTCLFHRAEHPQAFGDSAENGRLALICFASFEDGTNRRI